jgi:hypothetical protein
MKSETPGLAEFRRDFTRFRALTVSVPPWERAKSSFGPDERGSRSPKREILH